MLTDKTKRDSPLYHLLEEDESVLASLPVRHKRNGWTYLGRMVLALISGGIVFFNKDLAEMVLTDKRILFIPAVVAFEAPLIPPGCTEAARSIPCGDILGARFRLRWLPARYLWGSTLTLRTKQGAQRFSIDRAGWWSCWMAGRATLEARRTRQRRPA